MPSHLSPADSTSGSGAGCWTSHSSGTSVSFEPRISKKTLVNVVGAVPMFATVTLIDCWPRSGPKTGIANDVLTLTTGLVARRCV
jgi:hypothetical protein